MNMLTQARLAHAGACLEASCGNLKSIITYQQDIVLPFSHFYEDQIGILFSQFQLVFSISL